MEAETVPGGSVVTPGILNCTQSRSFWISWLNGAVSVGQGCVINQNVIINYTDPNPIQIGYMGLAGWLISQPGTWSFAGCYYNGMHTDVSLYLFVQQRNVYI